MSARQTLPQGPGVFRAIACLITALLAAALPMRTPAADFDLEIDGDRITLNSNGADIGEILRGLAEHAGFRLVIPVPMSKQPLRLQMQNVSLDRVLNRLLRNGNFVVITGDDDQVVAIHILPRGNEQTVFLDNNATSESPGEAQENPPEIPLTNAQDQVDLADILPEAVAN